MLDRPNPSEGATLVELCTCSSCPDRHPAKGAPPTSRKAKRPRVSSASIASMPTDFRDKIEDKECVITRTRSPKRHRGRRRVRHLSRIPSVLCAQKLVQSSRTTPSGLCFVNHSHHSHRRQAGSLGATDRAKRHRRSEPKGIDKVACMRIASCSPQQQRAVLCSKLATGTAPPPRMMDDG